MVFDDAACVFKAEDRLGWRGGHTKMIEQRGTRNRAPLAD
jgi:hypothetical protein